MTQGKLWVGLIVLFFAGVLTGIVGTIAYHRYEQQHARERGPAAREQRIMKRLTHDLSLTAEQQAAIEPIVRRAHLEVLRLRLEHQPEVERIVTAGIAEAKTKLSPEQQAKLDAVYAQLQRRWQASRDYLQAHGGH
jgi:Spy/CpxP family protein refolding chaperone